MSRAELRPCAWPSLAAFANAGLLAPRRLTLTCRSASSVAFPAPHRFAFAEPVAFGAALRGGFAASSLLRFSLSLLNLQLFLSMLSTFLLLSPIHEMNTGASLRDRATLPRPLRGLGPSGGYPSRLRSLRSLRAPLGPAVRRCSVLRRHGGSRPVVFSLRVRCAPRASQASPHSPLTAAPSSGFASAPCHPVAASLRVSLTRRRSHSRTPSCALPRRGPPAHAPRRLSSGSVSGTVLPDVQYPGFGLLYALRRLGSHTPRSGLPEPPQAATTTLNVPFTTPPPTRTVRSTLDRAYCAPLYAHKALIHMKNPFRRYTRR